jgi:hypothetical protein
MALQISTYVDPGVYIQEVIAPGALNLQTLPILPTLIANGSRVRRAVNEDIVRGLVSGEALTVSGTSPHIATLAGRGTRRVGETTVFADGVALSDDDISYPAATLTGTTSETFDVSTNNAFVLQMDQGQAVTITLTDGASAVAINGTQIDVTTALGTAGAAATAAEVAAGINAALAAATALGYGSNYASVASDSSGSILLTSPVSGVNSNITIAAAITTDASAALFGTALQSATVIRISDVAFDSAVAAYTINYIDRDDVADSVANAGAQTFIRVGAFPGVTTFRQATDYAVPSAGVLNWSTALVAATTQGVDGTLGFDLSSNDVLRLAFDGRATIDIDLNGLGSAPLGYASPASPSAATPAEVAANINAVVGASTTYGPAYSGVASVSNNRVVLTSPTAGSAGSVTIRHPATLDATTEIFGLGATQNLTVNGTGAAPALGSTYFATYEFTRPAADYDNPRQFFTLDQALEFTGPLSATNPLSIGSEIIFRNGAPSILVVQVDDASNPGTPAPVEIQASLDAAATRSVATDIVVLDTDLDVQVRLLQHVEDQSGPIEQNFRRGYFGMPVNTAIGDRDTADTLVFRAARTLQVAPDSPARGRLMLVAPPGIEGIRKELLLEDGSIETVTLDSTYLACAIVGRLASFASPADALVRVSVAGFRANEDDFTPWVRSERAALASAGVTVVTFDAGRFLLLDPISTERAGGGLIQFEQWSTSVQKDNISRQVRQALDANVVGIVPVDVADFIIDIKQFIANVLTGAVAEGAIGPYTDPNGNRRAIDLNQDIIVEQSPTDPTQYNFSFFFNLRYPALRLFGQYSVDNPFFAQAA